MQTNLLSNLLKSEDGEILFTLFSESFVSKNKDVEAFLKTKAVQSVKLYTSSTYLVYESAEYIDLLGYFTLATKMQDSLALIQRQIHSGYLRFCWLNSEEILPKSLLL